MCHKVVIFEHLGEFNLELLGELSLDVEVLIISYIDENITISNLPITLKSIYTYNGKLEDINTKIYVPFGCKLYENILIDRTKKNSKITKKRFLIMFHDIDELIKYKKEDIKLYTKNLLNYHLKNKRLTLEFKSFSFSKCNTTVLLNNLYI